MSNEKFCMLRAPICRMSASSATGSTWLGSITSVTMGNPVSALVCTRIFLIPMLIHAVWPQRGKLVAWVRTVAFGLLGTSLYLYLPVRAAQSPLMNWGGTSRLDAFWRHITGWQYSGWVGTENLDDLNRALAYLGARIWDNLPWIASPLALVGIWALWQRRRGLAITHGGYSPDALSPPGPVRGSAGGRLDHDGKLTSERS